MATIVLVGPELEENLGLRYLASSLQRAGFATEIVPFNAGRELERVAEAILALPERPLAVALSLAFQWRALDFLALAVALRERGYDGHITAGGHFGTFTAKELLRDFPELDSICRHEAENTIVELARVLAEDAPVGSVSGLAFRDVQGMPQLSAPPSPPELATLPWPDRRGEPMSCLGHPIAAMVGSRGCYANCAFCCIAAWHEQTLPGKRYRLRPIGDVAEEMAALRREQHTEIFVFHDDNFFLPSPAKSLERIESLAEALKQRGVGPIATVVKARPDDVTPEVFRAMQQRLGCNRVFLGIESASTQGLETLQRDVTQEQNVAAMKVLNDLGLYVCFNVLLFDPDTTLEGFETNLAFMEANAETPFNFGRVELYAGTPLLARLEKEGRCVGDYLGHDYELASPMMQRIFKLAMRCFFPRNFEAGSMANRLMGTRYDVEVCRSLHPKSFKPEWLEEAKTLSRRLARDSVAGLREIAAYVQHNSAGDEELVADLSARLRLVEDDLRKKATALEERIQRATGAKCQHARPNPLFAPEPKAREPRRKHAKG